MNDKDSKMSEAQLKAARNDETMAKLVYVLYLVGLFTGIAGIIGVVIAYIHKSDAPAWLKSHYQFQIRTFWIGFLYLFLGTVLSIVLIGWLVLAFWFVWLIIRCIKGLQAIDREEPYADPTTWMF
jgi:uncharacterized membrane protein